jgi:DNA invertase Pin-like site-specific DNA recombinase
MYQKVVLNYGMPHNPTHTFWNTLSLTTMSTIAYLRSSSQTQSTDSQRHAINERYNIEKWFADDATSGTVKALQRPEFSNLINYVRSGDTVVVFSISRLGRDTIDVLTTVEALQAKGVTLISMQEGFDLSTDIGKAMLTMLSAVAELERKQIAHRRDAGIAKAKASGKHCGRPVTHGADMALQVNALLAGGMKPSEVQRTLNLSRSTFYRLTQKN